MFSSFVYNSGFSLLSFPSKIRIKKLFKNYVFELCVQFFLVFGCFLFLVKFALKSSSKITFSSFVYNSFWFLAAFFS